MSKKISNPTYQDGLIYSAKEISLDGDSFWQGEVRTHGNTAGPMLTTDARNTEQDALKDALTLNDSKKK